MDTKIKEVVDYAKSQNAKVEIFGDSIVQVLYIDGRIARHTLKDGILTTETMYTGPKGNTYYSEIRKDPIKQKLGPDDLLAKFQTDGNFYNDDGTTINDIESLQNKREEINSMNDKIVLEKFGKDKKFLDLLIGDAIDTIVRREEKEREKDKDKDENSNTEQYVNFDDVDF